MLALINGEYVQKNEQVAQIPEIEISYEKRVVSLIREKYSIDEELAIQRQRDTKPKEFAEYNAFCERIKAEERAV